MKGYSYPGKSPVKQKVDPDAPGTPGTPGYEPSVKRSDLDAKGKAIFDKNKNKQVPLSEGEKRKGTMITGGNKAEVINDLEDRIEFLQSDIKDEGQEGPTKQRAQLMKLQKELAKLRKN